MTFQTLRTASRRAACGCPAGRPSTVESPARPGRRGRRPLPALLLAGGLLIAALLAGVWPAPAAANTCEALRDQIEARIRGNGVDDPVVRIVDAPARPAAAEASGATASAPLPQPPREAVGGQVVGTCDRGARLIVFSRGGPAPGAAAAGAAPGASAAPAPRRSGRRAEIVECFDGRAYRDGPCRPPPPKPAPAASRP